MIDATTPDPIPSTENADADPLWAEVGRIRTSVYALGQKLQELHDAAVAIIIALVDREGERLPAYLTAHGIEPGDKPERALIAYMADGLKANRLSEITAVIKLARRQGVKPDAAPAWLRNNGGVDGLYKSRERAKTKPRAAASQPAEPTKAAEPPRPIMVAAKPVEPPKPPEPITVEPSKPAGFDPLEPILTGPMPPKLGMSDERKAKGREFVEKAFHSRNTVGDTINFVRAYHRTIGDWSPSDLDIGSYVAQIGKLKEIAKDAQRDSMNQLHENVALRKQIRELESQLQSKTNECKNLEAEIAIYKRTSKKKAA